MEELTLQQVINGLDTVTSIVVLLVAGWRMWSAYQTEIQAHHAALMDERDWLRERFLFKPGSDGIASRQRLNGLAKDEVSALRETLLFSGQPVSTAGGSLTGAPNSKPPASSERQAEAGKFSNGES